MSREDIWTAEEDALLHRTRHLPRTELHRLHLPHRSTDSIGWRRSKVGAKYNGPAFMPKKKWVAKLKPVDFHPGWGWYRRQHA